MVHILVSDETPGTDYFVSQVERIVSDVAISQTSLNAWIGNIDFEPSRKEDNDESFYGYSAGMRDQLALSSLQNVHHTLVCIAHKL